MRRVPRSTRSEAVVDALRESRSGTACGSAPSSRPCRRCARGARRGAGSTATADRRRSRSLPSRRARCAARRARPTSRRAPRAAPDTETRGGSSSGSATGRRRSRSAARGPGTFWMTPCAASPCSRTGSAEKPSAGASSAANGHTWRSSGSCGSPLRMRATKPRGTSSGNAVLAGGPERCRRQLEQAQQLGRVADRAAQLGLPRRQRAASRSARLARVRPCSDVGR